MEEQLTEIENTLKHILGVLSFFCGALIAITLSIKNKNENN